VATRPRVTPFVFKGPQRWGGARAPVESGTVACCLPVFLRLRSRTWPSLSVRGPAEAAGVASCYALTLSRAYRSHSVRAAAVVAGIFRSMRAAAHAAGVFFWCALPRTWLAFPFAKICDS